GFSTRSYSLRSIPVRRAIPRPLRWAPGRFKRTAGQSSGFLARMAKVANGHRENEDKYYAAADRPQRVPDAWVCREMFRAGVRGAVCSLTIYCAFSKLIQLVLSR